jgi:hypothetical protein
MKKKYPRDIGINATENNIFSAVKETIVQSVDQL